MSSRSTTGGPASRRGGGRRTSGAGPPLVGSGPQAAQGMQLGVTPAHAHVRTVGVRRPREPATAGQKMQIYVNALEVDNLPPNIIHHYDVAILGEKNYPPRFNIQLIKELQLLPQFQPNGVYDGKKNLFMPQEIPLGPQNSAVFPVALARNGHSTRDRPPRVYQIQITKAAEINPESLQRFIEGRQSLDEHALTSITALNVIVRMDPMYKYTFNTRCFFTDRAEKRDIGRGLELWRGYFQSVRPTLGRMLINIDISTALFYKSGPLISLALDFFRQRDPINLSPSRGFTDRLRVTFQKFISGIRISVKAAAPGSHDRIVVIQKLSSQGARDIRFQTREGQTISVADYFRQQSNRSLTYPDVICAQTASGAAIPLERCTVLPGQFLRRQIPPEVTREMVEFSTKRPSDRLQSITQGIQVFGYGQSEYVRNFGMSVNTTRFPLTIEARVLPAPRLKYGQGSKQPDVVPRDGAWNMQDKKFMQSATIKRWAVVVFEDPTRFNQDAARSCAVEFMRGCQNVGIVIEENTPVIEFAHGQGYVADHLKRAGAKCVQKNKSQGGPDLLLVILPDGGNDLYKEVKHFGDIQMGVATQCLKASKCKRANSQYWANVALKVNPKLGGVNVVPDSRSASFLVDPRNPAIIMGADVAHPPPGSDTPSFTAVVGNVDSNTAKYVATSRVQASRVEMIADLEEMAKDILSKYMDYRRHVEKLADVVPRRLIFFRDGVSEGQYSQVMEQEMEALKNACRALQISPKITFVIVAKRHHWRLFPQNERQGDRRSGNLPAGTVVDRGITHPLEFDFYLLSHGGILGTSRPAHYHVLYDDNGFSVDSLQAFSYTLCHVYARSTRSVSIPAPVYYADIVCSRATNHFDPRGQMQLSETGSVTSGGGSGGGSMTLESYRQGYRPLHSNQSRRMYFM